MQIQMTESVLFPLTFERHILTFEGTDNESSYIAINELAVLARSYEMVGRVVIRLGPRRVIWKADRIYARWRAVWPGQF